MHVLFLHQQFPAQFGHVARFLVEQHNFRCTFVSEKPARNIAGIELLQYSPKSGARETTHFCSRPFENQIWHSHAVFEALASRSDIQPDLIVGHSGFASTLFLRELFDCPIINYFEYFYRTRNSDFDFRGDLPPTEPIHAMRARTRNAILLLDLENCNAGYSPTDWQRSQLPREFQSKLTTIFDGIDTDVWRPQHEPPRRIGTWTIPKDKRVVTYVSRGLEAMRGFDIFMRVAKRICELRNDVVFIVIGEDRVAYGGDLRYTGGKTFKQWVLAQDDYDLSRILFTGRISARQLAAAFSLSDVHLYLTAPFVLSWSLLNALACGATVMASDTPPVREMIRHDINGLLVDFFDTDAWVERLQSVLDDPISHKPLGEAGIEMVHQQYSVAKCLPQMLDLYQRVTSSGSSR